MQVPIVILSSDSEEQQDSHRKKFGRPFYTEPPAFWRPVEVANPVELALPAPPLPPQGTQVGPVLLCSRAHVRTCASAGGASCMNDSRHAYARMATPVCFGKLSGALSARPPASAAMLCADLCPYGPHHLLQDPSQAWSDQKFSNALSAGVSVGSAALTIGLAFL